MIRKYLREQKTNHSLAETRMQRRQARSLSSRRVKMSRSTRAPQERKIAVAIVIQTHMVHQNIQTQTRHPGRTPVGLSHLILAEILRAMKKHLAPPQRLKTNLRPTKTQKTKHKQRNASIVAARVKLIVTWTHQMRRN